jgi:hypothetical protein
MAIVANAKSEKEPGHRDVPKVVYRKPRGQCTLYTYDCQPFKRLRNGDSWWKAGRLLYGYERAKAEVRSAKM